MIKPEEIQKLADLSRIALTDTEKEKMAGEIDSILEYVGQIKEAAGLPRAESRGEESREAGVIRNVFREDADPHESGVNTEELLNEAPKREKDYVAVKKIL